ncbi:MAG: SRPBCC family protein, partial [Gammaproteobacteria bacterium]
VAGRTSGLIGPNESVTFQAKHFGVPLRFTTKITQFNYPAWFVDELVEGAFKFFRHEHYFETRNDQTLMVDIFSIEFPFGVVGKILGHLFLIPYLTKLVTKRNKLLKDAAESGRRNV